MTDPAATPSTIAGRFPQDTLWLRGFLLVTAITLAAGLTLPIVTIEKFVFFENTFSVLSGIRQLLHEGKYFLFGVITGFSVILPLLKLYVLLRLLLPGGHGGETMRRYLHLMHLYGKWSMLDVFVVAVLVVSVKLGAIASVQIQPGLYAFGGAVLLMMLITARVVQLTDRLGID
jgi:paraquat-inducible protein A